MTSTGILDLETTETHRYRAPASLAAGGGENVFGGQLLAQLVVAATRALNGRVLTSLQAIFARGARADEDVCFDADVIAEGRNAASARITVQQGERRCGEALALSLTPQDLAPAHTLPIPLPAGTPDDAAPMRSG